MLSEAMIVFWESPFSITIGVHFLINNIQFTVLSLIITLHSAVPNVSSRLLYYPHVTL